MTKKKTQNKKKLSLAEVFAESLSKTVEVSLTHESSDVVLFSAGDEEVTLDALLPLLEQHHHDEVLACLRPGIKPDTEGTLSGTPYVAYSRVRDIDNLHPARLGWAWFGGVLESIATMATAAGVDVHINCAGMGQSPIMEVVFAKAISRQETRTTAQAKWKTKSATASKPATTTTSEDSQGAL